MLIKSLWLMGDDCARIREWSISDPNTSKTDPKRLKADPTSLNGSGDAYILNKVSNHHTKNKRNRTVSNISRSITSVRLALRRVDIVAAHRLFARVCEICQNLHKVKKPGCRV